MKDEGGRPAVTTYSHHRLAPLLDGLKGCLNVSAFDCRYREPAPGHAAEPGLLALGKLSDSGFKVGDHRPVGLPAGKVGADLAIFQPEALQSFSGDALVQKIPDLSNHAVSKPAVESVRDAFAQLLPFGGDRQNTEVELEIQGFGIADRAPVLGRRNLQSPDHPAAAGAIGSGVDLGRCLEQTFLQFLSIMVLEFVAEFDILINICQTEAPEDRLDIEPGAADHQSRSGVVGEGLAVGEAVEDLMAVPLIVEERVDLSGVRDIDQVVGDRRVDCRVVSQVLARADVQAPIDLTRIGRDDLAAQPVGHLHTEASLSGGGWSDND